MSLSYAELWFLELPVEIGGWIPFGCLPASQQELSKAFSPLWNMPTHSLTVEGIADTMWSLFIHHSVCFQHETDEEGVFQEYQPTSTCELAGLISEEYKNRRNCLSQVSLTRKEGRPISISSCLHNQHFYSLTPQGVDRWAEYAQPDWSLYRGGVGSASDDSGQILTATAPTVELAKEMLAIGSTDSFMPVEIYWESLRCENLRPWDLFPGKQLPAGFRLTVQVTALPRDKSLQNDFHLVQKRETDYWQKWNKICPPWYHRGIKNHPDRPLPAYLR